MSGGLLEAQEQTYSADNGTKEQKGPPHTLPIPFPIQIIEDEKDAISREAREAKARQREIDSLEAQQAMKKATQSMNCAAWASAIFVFIGTGLLFWTLALTRQANSAAREAVDVTRRIGEAQVRAYLSFDIASGDVKAGSPLKFEVIIKNRGQSPAVNVAVASTTFIRERGWVCSDKKETPPQGAAPAFTIYPGGQTVVFVDSDPPTPLKTSHINRLKAADSTVFGSVTVYYEDVFGEKREAAFLFEFTGEQYFKTGHAKISSQGNYDGKRRENAPI